MDAPFEDDISCERGQQFDGNAWTSVCPLGLYAEFLHVILLSYQGNFAQTCSDNNASVKPQYSLQSPSRYAAFVL